MTRPTARIVSSEGEALILVDEHDNEIGSLSKAECHDGDGILHRAFSVFLFDEDGALLVQQRAAGKRLWPLYWSNTCCSHPRVGESIGVAAARRLEDELHTVADLEFVYSFAYHASFAGLGSERELCHVFLGRILQAPRANATEIAAMRYLSAKDLDRELEDDPGSFTPWFKLEWERLKEEFGGILAGYTGRQRS
ncbi:MAG: isopentenyl-diphosphate Delta-isomerase [Gammaproteobacteria bacterium]|nr:isopentenyl-diphosphate Delta-isomerase [Gammaproteobacteria bacterium]MDH5344172.1 isopentenyl-diphosphate Delta-isomerase [Gammaproteobacteria bacterium]